MMQGSVGSEGTLQHLTVAEQTAVARARQLLERTHYDTEDGTPERVADARAVARALLELAEMLDAERGTRLALQRRTAPK